MDLYTKAARYRPSPLRAAQVVAALVGTFWQGSLHAQAPARLDTISVVASRVGKADAGRSVDVITRDAITTSSARTVSELLAARLGIDVSPRSPAQADLSIRGSSPEQVAVLVDGVRVSDVQSAHYALDLAVPLEAIERVEVLRGAASALYGPDAVGGVINIVTRRGGVATRVATRAGAFQTLGGELATSLTAGATTITPTIEYDRSNGARNGTDYRTLLTRIGAEQRLSAGLLTAHLGVGVRDFGAANFYAPYNSFERTGSATADLRLRRTLGEWTLESGVQTRRHTDRFTLIRDNPAVYENLHTSWQSGLDVIARRSFGSTALAIGADALNAQLQSARLGSRNEWREALFSELTVAAPAGSTLLLGLRGDQSSTYGAFLSPSATFDIPLEGPVGVGLRGMHLRANVARGFRAPTWTERYYRDPASVGNPNLQSEQFWTGELGLRFAPSSDWSADLVGYSRSADNLIDWVKATTADAATPWLASNVGSATFRGVELSTTYRSGGAEYTLSHASIAFDAASGAGLRGRYALRPVTAQTVARVSVPATHGARVSADLMRAQRAGEVAYITANLRYSQRVGGLTVDVDGRNLTNAGWLDGAGAIVPGRALYVGLSWRGGEPPR